MLRSYETPLGLQSRCGPAVTCPLLLVVRTGHEPLSMAFPSHSGHAVLPRAGWA